jgi:endonuclease/exonuclease/phosphatase family metal-dependent hydrolase
MGADRASALTGMRAAGRHLTFPADAPREQLDHILVDGEVDVVASAAPRLELSDHRALVAELELP